MVDISVEILASVVPIQAGCFARHRLKTSWAHVDVPPGVTFIKIPRLPMIQQYLIMTGKDTTVFVETWHDASKVQGSSEEGVGGGGGGKGDSSKFLGMAVCTVDEQLKNPKLNPSVQWLDVYDPIDDIKRGKLLLKIDAKFALLENPTGAVINSTNNNYYADNGASFDDSPAKLSAVSSTRSRVSRKSDTSVFSVASGSSVISHDRSVQTDLSLPMLPDITKFTTATKSNVLNGALAVLRSHSLSSDPHQRPKQLRRQDSKSESDVPVAAPVPSSPIVDDAIFKAADNFIQQQQNRSSQYSHSSSLSSSKKEAFDSSFNRSEFRKSCLIKQHLQQIEHSPILRHKTYNSSGSGSGSGLPSDYDVNNVDDVIDMLNDNVFSSPSTSSHPQRSEEPLRDLDLQQLEPKTDDNKRNDYGRFKEVHFDGVHVKHAAKVMLMSKSNVKPSDLLPPPPHATTHLQRLAAGQAGAAANKTVKVHPGPSVPPNRRRIAAAIFND